MSKLLWLKEVLDYLGGVVDSPPADAPRILSQPIFRGLWWALLLILIVIFSGQTSRFIYIDF